MGELKEKVEKAKNEDQATGGKTGRRPRCFAHRSDFTIIIRCLLAPKDHPEWQDKEWVSWDDPAMIVGHNQAYWQEDYELLKGRLTSSAHRIARTIECNEGGQWIGRLRDATNDPRPDRCLTMDQRRGLDLHILHGPDGPGRRFLRALGERMDRSMLSALADNLKPVPEMEKPITVATREMMDRLREKPPAPALGPLDNRDLWVMTDDLPKHREAGEGE